MSDAKSGKVAYKPIRIWDNMGYLIVGHFIAAIVGAIAFMTMVVIIIPLMNNLVYHQSEQIYGLSNLASMSMIGSIFSSIAGTPFTIMVLALAYVLKIRNLFVFLAFGCFAVPFMIFEIILHGIYLSPHPSSNSEVFTANSLHLIAETWARGLIPSLLATLAFWYVGLKRVFAEKVPSAAAVTMSMHGGAA